MEKKITKATLKSFINKNRDNLYLKVKSSFDGSVDSTIYLKDPQFKKAVASKYPSKENMGIEGVWVVDKPNLFSSYKEDGWTGIEVFNCCAHFVVAIKE